MNIDFTETMNEISGFGGYYERCCRRAVTVGAQWCLTHPLAFDAAEVERAIRGAEINTDDGRHVSLYDELTGTQLGVAMHHIRFIAEHSWNEYREKMSAPLALYSEPCMDSADEPAEQHQARSAK